MAFRCELLGHLKHKATKGKPNHSAWFCVHWLMWSESPWGKRVLFIGAAASGAVLHVQLSPPKQQPFLSLKRSQQHTGLAKGTERNCFNSHGFDSFKAAPHAKLVTTMNYYVCHFLKQNKLCLMAKERVCQHLLKGKCEESIEFWCWEKLVSFRCLKGDTVIHSHTRRFYHLKQLQ